MSRLLTVAGLVIAAASGCAPRASPDATHPAAPTPGEPAPVAAAPVPPGVEPNAAALTLTLVGVKDTRDGKVVRFRLRNGRAEAVHFSGYRRDFPRTQIDKLTAAGWQEWSADWCGTGAGYYEVPAGGSVEFGITLGEVPGPFRVGVYCRDETVWSDKIDLAP